MAKPEKPTERTIGVARHIVNMTRLHNHPYMMDALEKMTPCDFKDELKELVAKFSLEP